MPRIIHSHLQYSFVRAALSIIVVALVMLIALALPAIGPWKLLESASAASTFTVTNTNDSGSGSLRQAILDANANPGPDTIAFNIPGPGVKTITPVLGLPDITDPVVIDGTTQPGYAGTPIIELSGGVNAVAAGINIHGGNSTLRALIINRFNGWGVGLFDVGGNHIEGCYIGVNAAGTAALPNSGYGITVRPGSSNNFIGGTTVAARNVISGNSSAGIYLTNYSNNLSITGNVIEGNYIGTNAGGTSPLPNGREGICVCDASATAPLSDTVIGGTAPGAGNLISANKFEGVSISSFYVTGTLVQGNLVGTDVTGTLAFPNGRNGIAISFARNNTIGGTTPAARNVVSSSNFTSAGGGTGIAVGGDGNIVQGNYVGTDINGVNPLPNANAGIGVGGSNNVIGGTTPGAGNLVAFNGRLGIGVGGSTNNRISGNSVFSNQGLGIDLSYNGVTPNDTADADSGDNNLQNFPLLTSVARGGSDTTIVGTLNSAPATTFNVEFFAGSACDESGNGEGAAYFGSVTATTDASGDASFNAIIPKALGQGQVITATATDPAGNTSEFSPCDASGARGAAQFDSVLFNLAQYSVAESDGAAVITVARVGGSSGTLSVNYATSGGGTATANSDYIPVSGTLTFADGETSKSFIVPIISDGIAENQETVRLALRGATLPDMLGYYNNAILSITDSAPLPVLSVQPASVTEGDTGTTDAVVTVSLSSSSTQTVTVQYHTTPIDATSGVDYQPVSGTLTFNPGETSKTVNVPVIGDTLDEPDEYFLVQLSNATNASVSVSSNPPRVTIVDNDPAATFQFSSASYTAGEGAHLASITVLRSGDTSAAATVSYSTSDGTANQRSDYTLASGTLNFASGETSKSFDVLLTDNAYVDGNRTVNLSLQAPAGSGLGAQATAVLTLTDNDAVAPTTNPIDDAQFFVRQQYADFLNRAPDAGGLGYWTSQITACGSDAQCIHDRRVAVADAFFFEPEFQQTGGYIYRIYKAALGLKPTYAQFVSDRGRVVAGPGLDQSKTDYALFFVRSGAFQQEYGTATTADQFVDRMLTVVKNYSGVDLSAQRGSLINLYDGTDTGKAAILRQVAESQALIDAEYNPSFVLMEYFGYLRRDPDQGGYDFWLAQVNKFPLRNVEIQHAMACSFITSAEYQTRFSPVVTHTNRECPQ
jgi:parallel beta-helix repeat protein